MHVEDVLEFESLRALLGRYVRSALGRGELDSVAPVSDRSAIEAQLADAAEAIEYLRTAARPQPASRGAAIRVRFDEIDDPGTSIARLRIEGATLEAQEIFELARLLDLAAEARSVLLAARDRFPRIGVHASGIADLRELTNDLRGKILPDGSVADFASVALARLRRDVERQRHQIQQSLERFLRTHHEDGTLQEDFVTIRNDRFVVPVVTGRERRVEGVIHGASGSGHTLFVEPLETIELNNELVRLHEEELREVHRILREFTARLREHAVEIGSTARALGTLELLFAKAEFALDFHCCIPKLSPENARRLNLREARHPLLVDLFRTQKKNVVPVSLSLDDSERTLLISGPNTGGKTVALKTVGLLALMTQAGLPVPAVEAEFPVFDEVLADIGDHQSIQESLSSFSAHIMALRRMLEAAGPDSLVLIDELGRATDPEEGGALGVAVLEDFRRRGGFTLASTHLMAMKVYGAATTGVRNGSMGFDDETLEPTYVLRLGAPGKSAGLDIASRLGLDPALIAAARERMTSAERDVSHFLSELNTRLDAIEQERREIAERVKLVSEREQSLQQTWERKYAAKLGEIEQRAATLAGEFEQRAHETIEDLSQKARTRIAKTKREYQESVEAITVPASKAAGQVSPPRLKLEPGARVRLKGIRQPATVRRLLAGDLLEVDAGFLKMQVSSSDVEEVLPAGEGPTKAVSFRQGPSFDGSYREINVIGQRAEAAVEQVDKMLDSAALAQVDRVRIVHGHGMGILKRAIADLLKENPHVEKFYFAPPEQGGSGATIVELK
ncbi:MAG TPA: Smr/MutS family protein [Bryobacteraceae bacterium]|nr:Smr/MutS family protein [Bryobacteraceae bacterium]